MSDSDDSNNRWEEIARDLLAYRDAQRNTWGGMDDITLAKYIAGTASADERNLVERMMIEKQAVGELVHVVSEVLQPLWMSVPAAGQQIDNRNATKLLSQ